MGRQTVLHIDTMVAQWKDYDLSLFFDYDYFKDNWKDIITEEENYDRNNYHGQFEVTKEWGIIVVYNNSSEYSDDETVQMNIDELVECAGQDVWEKWSKVYVND